MPNVDILRTNFRKGQQFTHQEANILTTAVKAIWKSLIKRGFIDSAGINTREPNPKKIGIVRKAFVKTTPGAVETVACYLDTDATGDEVTVNCSVIGGTALNAAVPRLADGEIIFVTFTMGAWWCSTTFQASQDCT